MDDYNQNKTVSVNSSSKPTKKPTNKKSLWFAIFSSIIIYNIVAISISATEKDFRGNGFVKIENNIYSMIFFIFLFFSLIQFIIIFKINSKDKKETSKLSPEKENYFFGLKIAMANAIAIYGIALFLINGNYNHLLLFTGLGLSGMLYIYKNLKNKKKEEL